MKGHGRGRWVYAKKSFHAIVLKSVEKGYTNEVRRVLLHFMRSYYLVLINMSIAQSQHSRVYAAAPNVPRADIVVPALKYLNGYFQTFNASPESAASRHDA